MAKVTIDGQQEQTVDREFTWLFATGAAAGRLSLRLYGRKESIECMHMTLY